MISATSLNPSSLNKGHQMPLSLENGRLRVDSQKFLVPSLPVARGVGGNHTHAQMDPKRRERSIVNGTAHPHPSDNNSISNTHYSHNPNHNHHGLVQSFQPQSHHLVNGMRHVPINVNHALNHGSNGGGGRERERENGHSHGHGSRESSPHNHNHNPNGRASSSPHHNHNHGYLHVSNSPRKDALSPMYAGEVPRLSPGGGGNYSGRTSMPIPCSSPAQASSASPKGSPVTGGGNYSPKLPSAMLPGVPPDLGSRLYPGFPPPHPSVAAHLGPAFYAAAAAVAAANHGLPYPLFPPFSPHSHSAATANAYLDSFHSALVNVSRGNNMGNGGESRSRSRSPSPSPPHHQHNRSHGTYHPAQQSHGHGHGHSSQGPNPHSTSVTSLHNKLIESTTIASERHGYSSHSHSHHHSHHHVPIPTGQFSPQGLMGMGLSKGGPLGISGGIMNLPSSSSRLGNGNGPSPNNKPQISPPQQPENLGHSHNHNHNHKGIHANVNGYHLPSNKQWMEHPGLNANENRGKNIAEMDVRREAHHHQHQQQHHNLREGSKVGKGVQFSGDSSCHTQNANSRFPPSQNPHIFSHPHLHNHQMNNLNNHPQHSHQGQGGHGVLTDSNAKKQSQSILHNSQQQQQFLPPSPKKRGAPWSFAVPASPGSKIDLPPPPPPPPLNSNSATNDPNQSKYLNSQSLNHLNKPSTHYSIASSSAQNLPSSLYHPHPASPRSGPSTPKSPSVHQVKFSFSSGSSKENAYKNKNCRNDSSSSSSSSEGNVPWPVEQMPILEAFKRGSLIKLANGDLRPVEDLRAEDFIQAVASMSGSLKIINCTVLSIQQHENGSLCKVTMTVGSNLQNQQVVVPSSPEQPFFVLGRGWSSLSPKMTEKMLQLPCSPLQVGDVCITLSKSTPVIIGKNHVQHQVPKSPSTRGRKPGSGKAALNATKSPTTKRPHPHQSVQQSIRESNLVQKPPLSDSQTVNSSPNNSKQNVMESIKNPGMGPAKTSPPISPPSKAVSPPESTDGNGGQNDDADNLGPSSPKRRRWSAPVPDIPPSPLQPSTSGSASASSPKILKEEEKEPKGSPPTKTVEQEQIPVSDSHNSLTTSPKTDVNSNVSMNVKDEIIPDQRRSPDAQSATA